MKAKESAPQTKNMTVTAQTHEVKKTAAVTKRKKKKTKVATPLVVNNIKIDDRDVYAVNGRKIYKGGAF